MIFTRPYYYRLHGGNSQECHAWAPLPAPFATSGAVWPAGIVRRVLTGHRRAAPTGRGAPPAIRASGRLPPTDSVREVRLASFRAGLARRGRCSARQAGTAHQEGIDFAGALPAFTNRPDDERLTAPHVACGEHLGDAGGVTTDFVRRCLDVAARV